MVASSQQTDLEAKFAAIEELSLPDLRAEWRRLFRRPSPHRLSRDLLIRGIVYKLQEAAYGGLTRATLRRLKVLSDQSEAGSENKPTRQAAFKPGTKLLREWNGITHEVHVLADGFEWQGQEFKSLTKIAAAITGTHWSGPRFFGLTTRRDRPAPRIREDQDD